MTFTDYFNHAVRLANKGHTGAARRAFNRAIALADNDDDRALAGRYLAALD